MKRLVIAIDGVSGSGKSTLARYIARRLGYVYLDTGAMYRAATYKTIKEAVDVSDHNRVVSLLKRCRFEVKVSGSRMEVYIDGEDVTPYLRLPVVSDNVSRVSAIPGVRGLMVKYQRGLGKKGGIVAEGRDIGTVVFPNADIKFFLTADMDERVKRRYKDLVQAKIKVNLRMVKDNILLRDKKDSSRKFSPLKPAGDAIIIDTTNLTIQQKNRLIMNYIREYLRDDLL